MLLTDSRRLTGPNLIFDGPGAAAEITVSTPHGQDATAAWKAHARHLLDAIGWGQEACAVRLYAGGATLAITAPIDGLYVATEVVEAAWMLTEANLRGDDAPDVQTLITTLKDEIAQEANPALMDLTAAARSRSVAVLTDDEHVTLGLGKHAQNWPRDDLPKPNAVKWDNIADIPVALVTGTNGKSTTVRIAAAIGAAAGMTVGFSSSDWVKAGDTVIATGDYSGPEGARLALRNHHVDMAVIETARGGLLRRGLPLAEVTACLITNVAADHLGDYGIHDVEALADTKFTVSKAVQQSGTLILNRDDPRLLSRGHAFHGQVAWYGLSLCEADVPEVGYSAFVHNGVMTLSEDGAVFPILPVMDFIPALGGAAQYNVSNALGAITLMRVMGVEREAITQGLLNFESTPEDNPGRGNFLTVGGVDVILDFAHNPHGLIALTKAIATLPAKRRLYLCGQGGDRSDDDIYQLTKVIRDANPDAIIVKELADKLRGRRPGEVPNLIRRALINMNYPPAQTLSADTEFDATVQAFEWARAGDLLVLLVYGKREQTLNLIQKLQAENWQPGQPVMG